LSYSSARCDAPDETILPWSEDDEPVDSSPDDGEARPVRSQRPDTKILVLISHEALTRGWAEAE
jgi:hypothetical protein